MDNLQKAAALALEALEGINQMCDYEGNDFKLEEEITALREALAQPQCNQHPDAPHGFDRNASHSADRYVCECESWEQPQDNLNCKSVQARLATSWGYVKAQPQDHSEQHLNMVQGEWVDLTDGEAMDLWIKIASPLEFADALIAKFKEKNTPPSVEAAIERERLMGYAAGQMAVEAMRIETLEKAAQLCEAQNLFVGSGICAAAIRSMK